MAKPLQWGGGVLLFAACSAFAAEAPKPDAGKLAAQLGSPERDVRRQAVYDLGKLGPAAKDALPALITALEDADKQVWTGALADLANLGPAAKDAAPVIIQGFDPSKAKTGRDRDRQQLLVRSAFALSKIGTVALPAMIAALNDESALRRAGVARALGEMGLPAAEAAPALAGNLGHWDETVRRETVDALGQIGAPAVPPLITALDAKDEKARQGACAALGQIGAPASAAAVPLAALIKKETSVPVRAAALMALPRIGGSVDVIIALIVEGATGEEAELRHASINGLLSNRALVPKAIPALVVALHGDALPRRQRAALVIGRLGAAGQSGVPALMECARKEPQEPAYTDALAQVGPVAIPPLVDQLSKSKGPPAEQEWIFKALRGMGVPALAPLTAALASPQPNVRAGAATALAGMTITAPETIKTLVAAIGDKDPTVRASALRAASTIRSEQGNVLPKVEAALTDANPQVRQAAAASLAAMGAVSKLGVDGLLVLLNDPEAATQRNALQSLGGLGAGANKAVPTLVPLLNNPTLQIPAMDALGQIGDASKVAVPNLVKFIETGTDELRITAIRTLSGIGRAAAPALPSLYASLKNSSRDVRIQALEALAKVEPDDDKLLPVVLNLVKDPAGGGLRRIAAKVLGRFGDKAAPAIPVLLEMLTKDTERASALPTLRGMKIHDVEALTARLEDKLPAVRAFACEALGKLGVEAESAVPALQRRAQSDADPVKSAAKKAIEQITKPG